MTKRELNLSVSAAGLRELWQETQGDPRICIAVLDGAVDVSHPCFSGVDLTHIQNIVSVQAGDDYASQHGTHVASVIFAQHGSPVQGIAPQCRGLIIPIFSTATGQSLSCSQLDLARAINLAVEKGAHIINISGGELAASGVADSILSQAIANCAKSGVLIVAATGNDGCQCLHIPAAEPTVLAVGAMDSEGMPLEFSNWGDAYQKQGVLAPGQNIVGAAPGGGVVTKSGTSFATPIVTGVAALLLSLQLKQGKEPDPKAIQAAILETEDSCDPIKMSDCRKLLAGRLNIKAAHSKVAATSSSNIVGQEIIGKTNEIYPSVSGLARASISNHKSNIKQEKSKMTENEIINSPEISVPSEQGVLAAEYPIRPNEIATPVAPEDVSVSPSEIIAAGCGCGGDTQAAPSDGLGYVLGQLGYDFGTEANQDSFTQLAGTPLHDPQALLRFLDDQPAAVANVTWTLSLDATVVYAIQPYGPFANLVYDRLKEYLNDQLCNGVERVSIPGVIQGSVRLLNGQQVPILYPDIRGMYAWSTDALILACCGESPKEEKAAAKHSHKVDGVRNFLDRVYYEVRNLGTTAQERAMNYAATNAYQVSDVYNNAIEQDMKLDNMEVERSPICRPGSDCWDVKLVFFNPAKRTEQARHVHRFTVDVSTVIPVTVGKVRHWDIY